MPIDVLFDSRLGFSGMTQLMVQLSNFKNSRWRYTRTAVARNPCVSWAFLFLECWWFCLFYNNGDALNAAVQCSKFATKRSPNLPPHLRTRYSTLWNVASFSVLIFKVRLVLVHPHYISVATCLRCGRFFSHHCIANLLLSLPMKECWKSVNIWLRYEIWWPTFGPRLRVPKSYSSCSCSSCWNQFSNGRKMPKAFSVRSGVQQNIHADIAHNKA